jgi:hypothetical protein
MIGPALPGYGLGTRCPVCHFADCPGCEPEADEDDNDRCPRRRADQRGAGGALEDDKDVDK